MADCEKNEAHWQALQEARDEILEQHGGRFPVSVAIYFEKLLKNKDFLMPDPPNILPGLIVAEVDKRCAEILEENRKKEEAVEQFRADAAVGNFNGGTPGEWMHQEEFADANRDKIMAHFNQTISNPRFICKKHGEVGEAVVTFNLAPSAGIPQKVPMDAAAFLRFGKQEQWTHEPLPAKEFYFCVRCMAEKWKELIGEVEEVKEQ